MLITLIKKNPISTKGSEITNGRYHLAAEGPRCLYLSSSEETALLETRIKQEDLILNKIKKSPKSTFFFNGVLQNVLDIRTKEKCVNNGVSYELVSEDWQYLNMMYNLKSYTQRLAKMAFSYGYEGIVYSSTKDKNGCNLVIFSENLRIDSFIELIGDDHTLQEIEENNRKIIGYLPKTI